MNQEESRDTQAILRCSTVERRLDIIFYWEFKYCKMTDQNLIHQISSKRKTGLSRPSIKKRNERYIGGEKNRMTLERERSKAKKRHAARSKRARRIDEALKV